MVVQGLAGRVLPARCAGATVVRGVRRLVRHGRAEQHLLPAAAAVDRRAVGAAGAGRLPLRGEGGPVRDASDEAPRCGVVVAQPPRPRLPAGRPPRAEPRPAAAEVATRRRSARGVPRVAPPSIRWAVELREPSWLHDDVFEVLARHNAALCIHDLLEGHPGSVPADWTYVRFHGPASAAAPVRRAYTGRRLWRPAERLAEWLHEDTDVYTYFNNDYDGAAIADARWLRDAPGDVADPHNAATFDEHVAGSARSGATYDRGLSGVAAATTRGTSSSSSRARKPRAPRRPLSRSAARVWTSSAQHAACAASRPASREPGGETGQDVARARRPEPRNVGVVGPQPPPGRGHAPERDDGGAERFADPGHRDLLVVVIAPRARQLLQFLTVRGQHQSIAQRPDPRGVGAEVPEGHGIDDHDGLGCHHRQHRIEHLVGRLDVQETGADEHCIGLPDERGDVVVDPARPGREGGDQRLGHGTGDSHGGGRVGHDLEPPCAGAQRGHAGQEDGARGLRRSTDDGDRAAGVLVAIVGDGQRPCPQQIEVEALGGHLVTAVRPVRRTPR